MQIIEFNGLPGSGKTTIAKELKQQLQLLGYTCLTSYKNDTLCRFFILCFCYPSCWVLLWRLLKLNAELSNDKQNRGVVLLIVRYYQTYILLKKRKKIDFFVVDQGIVQGIISLAHLKSIKNIKLLNAITSIIMQNISFMRVDCVSNDDLSFQRIRTRVPAGSRLEFLNNDELRSAFKIQTGNFEVVRKAFSVEDKMIIELDTMNSVEYNTQVILNLLFKVGLL